MDPWRNEAKSAVLAPDLLGVQEETLPTRPPQKLLTLPSLNASRSSYADENLPHATAISRLRSILGAAHVLASAEQVAAYSRCTVPWNKRCAAIVFPGDAREVSEVLRVARECKLRVWPFSRGHNWGYGSTMALEDGTLIVILERLNRILEVNAELAYAVIEPGVSYQQLNAHLKAKGIRLWADCTDSTPDGSVLGNALDKGMGYTPYGDHFGALCGLEAVLPGGQVVRTGGGPENSRTWHVHKSGLGPSLEGLFAQSNFGIVTKAGIWLMPEPEVVHSCHFDLRDESDLPKVLDELRRLALQGVLDANFHLVNDIVALSLATQYRQEGLENRGRLSGEQRARLREKYKLPSWSLGTGLYGSAAQVRDKERTLRKALARYGKLTFLGDRSMAWIERLVRITKGAAKRPLCSKLANFFIRRILGRSPEMLEAAPHLHGVLKGVPTEFFARHAYFKAPGPRPDKDVNPARDGCGLIWCAPVAPLTGGQVTELLELCRPLFKEYHFDFYMALLRLNPRSVVGLMSIFYNKQDPEECARAKGLYEALSAKTMAAGFMPYRAGLADMERLASSAPEFHHLANALKQAVDPQNLLAPGRYGLGNR